MTREKSKKRAAVKSSTVQVRLRPEQKAVIARAAKLSQTTLNNFILEHAYEAAQQVLADQVDIVMNPKDWEAFCKALDAPPRVIPALHELFMKESVLERQGKAAMQ